MASNNATARHLIERFPADSSMIKSMGYGDGVAVVEFPNGHLFAYEMSHAEWSKWRDSESKGKYFNQVIKGRVTGDKLTGKCASCGSEPELLGELCADCGGLIRAIDTAHKETR